MTDVAAVVVAAALAGVPAGVQSLGPWAGRRQLFVRFAGGAETATMYTSAALARELERQQSRSSFHSIVIGGRAKKPATPAATRSAARPATKSATKSARKPAPKSARTKPTRRK